MVDTFVQLLSQARLFVTARTVAHQAPLPQNQPHLPELTQVHESLMLSNCLILCHLFFLTSVSSSIRVFSNESALHLRRPKYWSFSFSISPSNEHPGLISFRWTGWISLQSKGLSRVFSNTTVKKHQFFGAQLSLEYKSHIYTRPLDKL